MCKAASSWVGRRQVAWNVLLLSVLVFLASACGPSESYLEAVQAGNRLQPGMTRQEAEEILASAVSHLRCEFDDTASHEVYLFGSKDLRKAQAIVILYSLESGDARVTRISQPSPELLQGAFNSGCVELGE